MGDEPLIQLAQHVATSSRRNDKGARFQMIDSKKVGQHRPAPGGQLCKAAVAVQSAADAEGPAQHRYSRRCRPE